MFSEFADEKHKEQAEEFLLALGKFTLAFERVCAAMRFLVMFMLRSQGLKNQDMEQVLIGDRGASDLRVLLSALYVELPQQDESDREAVGVLLGDIKGLTKHRNTHLHGNWDLGTEAADEKFWTQSLRFKKSAEQGALVEVLRTSTAQVKRLIQDAKSVQVRLQRLQVCISQAGFKVATELNKPL